MDKRLILVAGSGRSGTSLFSGILKALGCHIPRPEVTADNTNPLGFGEPQWVVDFHIKQLQAAAVQTSDARPAAWFRTAEVGMREEVENELRVWLRGELQHGDDVVIKDPRLLWFLPLWERVGESLGADVRYATVLRHPAEVVNSKHTYYGEVFNVTNRTAGWVNTTLYTERATREGRRVFVRYEDLLQDWALVIANVCEALELPVADNANTAQLRAVNQLIDPTLRRSQTSWESLGVPRPVVEMAEELWGLVQRLPEDAHDPKAQSELDDLRARYLEFYELAETTAQSSVVAAERDGIRKGRALALRAVKVEKKNRKTEKRKARAEEASKRGLGEQRRRLERRLRRQVRRSIASVGRIMPASSNGAPAKRGA